MTASRKEIVTSYRSLYRHALHAVQYSSPARYTVKAVLENTYRHGKPADFVRCKVNNTLVFLRGAAEEKGLEHRILKNLLHTWWWRINHKRSWRDHSVKNAQKKLELSQSTINHFEITLKMLNESMGMCLPTRLDMSNGLPEEDTSLRDLVDDDFEMKGDLEGIYERK